MDAFLSTLLPKESVQLEALRVYAEEHRVPILRADAASFMRTLTTLHQPKRILEIGTAIGYSALLMHECSPEARIDTVEIDPDTALIARKNIEAGNAKDHIRVIIGDGNEVLPALPGPYDMIFLDSAKGQYIHLYDDLKRLLTLDGLLVCDNCIFYDKIFVNPEEAPHKHRTIVHNLREFLTKTTHDADYTASLLQVGDGMLIVTKNR
ncbi:MAG: O-methyltransferase [Clostridia bacterium]|nr:O-methyltransferase [Clostridia bacterium]